MTTNSATVPIREGRTLPETTIGGYLIERLHALGVEDVFGIPGDYILTLYKMLEESPIRDRRHDPRGQRGLRRRRLRAAPRARVRLRHVLRRRPERVQQHRRGLCREVAGDRRLRLAGRPRARPEPAAPPQGPRVLHPARGLREDHRRLGRARRPGDAPSARSTACSPRRSGTSGRSTSSSPATWSRPAGPRRTARPPACRRATPMRSARPSTRPSSCSEGEAADDPGRRRGPPLRPPGRPDRPGRVGEPADRDDDPGQERDLRGAPPVRRRLRGGDGPRRGDGVRRGVRLPADARLLPDRHQPRHLHGQARPVEVHRRDERGPADPPPPLPRRPARRLPPRPPRPRAEAARTRRFRPSRRARASRGCPARTCP